MTITRTEEFKEADRYRYDLNECKDFAQVDTSQDASYFGIWACPVRRVIFTYCEGDCTTVTTDSDEEFCAEILKVREFANRVGKFHGIDPGLLPARREPWLAIGLGDLLH
jgi:hypothetical protein